MFIIRKDAFNFTPIPEYNQFCRVFEDSQRFFHQPFSDLINNFSFILGEEPEGIHLAFLLAQHKFFNSKKLVPH